MRGVVVALAVVVGSLSLDRAAHAEKCDLGGSTVLVQRIAGGSTDPVPTGGPGGQVDPWKVTVASAEAGPTTWLEEGDWEVGATGDVDGDGICDVVWTRWASGPDGVPAMVELSLGLTLPTGPPYTLVTPSQPAAHRFDPPGPGWTLVGSGDFDGDRRADIVLWHAGSRVLAVWISDGRGFEAGQAVMPGAPAPWRPELLADLDGNGRPEILWRDEATGHLDSWKVAWQGDGRLAVEAADPLQPSGPVDVNWRVRAADDFDGDGYEDLLLQNRDSERAVIWFMRGPVRQGGTFVSPARLAPADQPPASGVLWKIVAPR